MAKTTKKTTTKKTAKRLARGKEYAYRSIGPAGETKRRGIVRGFVPAGTEPKFPKSADTAKFKAELVNSIHDRYLVEIPRWHKRTGTKLASQWMAPKAVVMERTAKRV